MKNAQYILLIVLFLSIIVTGVRAQIILTELMHNPSNGPLPAYAYIEIYNKGNSTVILDGYKLQVANTRMELRDRSLAPKQYLLLVEPAAESTFQAYGNVLALPNWRQPGSTTGTIRLWDSGGNLVDELQYRNTWYASLSKRGGGWSLERKNPNFLCNTSESWGESQALMGGSPGERNSIWDPDFVPDLGMRVQALLSDSIKLAFGQRLDFSGAVNSLNFGLSSSANRVVRVERTEEGLLLLLAVPLTKDAVEKLSLIDFPCCGLIYQAEAVLFDASTIGFRDLVINEVLFNPKQGGGEFVEVYNRSGRIINMQDFYLGDRLISSELLLLEDAAFMLFTRSKSFLISDYPNAVLDNAYEMVNMPRYRNEIGDVVLKWGSFMVDSLRYTSSMHQPFLKDVKGVSLERIGYDVETNAAGSFNSAAILAGGATPGYANSSYVEKKDTENKVFLNSRTLSPDGDGFEDFLIIKYAFSIANPMLSIHIYDERGRRVNRLIRNQSAGRRGEVLWDGRDELGRVCPAGMYLCYAELYSSTGHFQSFKESFVLVKQQANY